MNDHYQYSPPPPVARPAASLAAVLLLVLVFFVGLAVGESGILSPAADARPPIVSVVPTPGPGPTSDHSSGPVPSAPANAPANFDLFWQALDTIRQNYVGRSDLTDNLITYGAIRGIVDALGDTGHTVFLSPESVQAESQSLSGSVVGVGILLGTRDDHPIVVSVISGGPADDAGIRAGDTILTVDGASMDGLAPEEVAPKIRGEEGTTVVVSIERASTGETIDFTMVREELHLPASTWTMIPGTKIALLRLIQFSSGAAADLRASRDSAATAGATSFILDLRSNPGGYVSEAVDTASLFLNEKTVYVRELADDQRIPVLSNDLIPATDAPLMVLIDQGTASSAEIVSAALSSNDRAQLIGDTTFGTGTVLLNFPLSDGSAIRLAVERWLTPDGDLIFGKGITPSVPLPLPTDQIPLDPTEVSQLTPEQVTTMPDAQLLKAIELLSQSASVDRIVAASGLGGV